MLTNPRVLIAESDLELRERLRHHLLERGVLSDIAANGGDALAQLDGRQYEIVLLDLALPIVGALQVFQRLAEIPSGERPIVMVTATNQDARMLDVELVQVILRKPLDAAAIGEVVANCLRPEARAESGSSEFGPPDAPRELRDH